MVEGAGSSIGSSHHKIDPARGPRVIAYPAMLDVPRELVREVARLLRAERRSRGTRKGSRALTCWFQALLGLAWFRSRGEIALLGAGFGVSRATAYRYRDEVIDVLAAQAPDLHEALQEVAEQGWSHVVLDGKLIRTDRCAETTESVKGETINPWYSGKHRAPGGNIQAVIRPDGIPIFVSDAAPGHQHDLTVARDAGVIAALNWAAAQLDTLAPARLASERLGAGGARCGSTREWSRGRPSVVPVLPAGHPPQAADVEVLAVNRAKKVLQEGVQVTSRHGTPPPPRGRPHHGPG